MGKQIVLSKVFMGDILRSMPVARGRRLLLQEAGVAGYALPAALGVDPGIGEAAPVLVGLGLVGSFGVVNADYDCRIGIHADLDVLNGEDGGFELRVFDIGEELGFIADLAIVLGVDEFVAQHGIEDAGVAIHLGFVPQVFHDQELGFLGIVFRFLGHGL